MAARRAVVAGAGLGGLTAALALHRRGWSVSVLERAPALEPMGAGISLGPNALRALDRVGVGEWLRSQATLAGPSGVRRPDGRWLARSDVGAAVRDRFDDPLVLVHRAELIDLLAAQLPPGTVQTSTSVTGLDPGADDRPAILRTDRGEVEADLVVAADGIRSLLRSTLFPTHPGPRYAGYTAWRTVVSCRQEIPSGSETWGRHGRRFAVLPLGADRSYCYATANAPAGVRADDEVAELTRLFGSWHDPIPQILASLATHQVLHQDVEALPAPLPAFHHGRAVLIGDAAHAMTPDLGQGGCMAVEDAVTVAMLLDGAQPVTPALARFTELRLPRTTAVARRSRRAGRLFQAPYAVQGLAARAMGWLPDTVVARGLQPIVDWHPPTTRQ
ncbi:MAG: FAD-dependent monooxygenase [Blastococcus sp.]